jgi:undecaprenyl diphosphate synthase
MNLSTINKNNIPAHVAIIMDGNGRWAKKQGKARVFGHQAGAETVRRILEVSGEIGIKYLTLYAFSTENWNRPKEEVDALMSLLVKAIHGELENLIKNQVRLMAIGNLKSLPEECQKELLNAIEKTANNKGITLILALSYSGRWEITNAIQQIAEIIQNGKLNAKEISEETICTFLNTKNIPDPDIVIRTGGEQRISNFLLWQIAYAEFFFPQKFWPEFQKEDFLQIITDYQSRERRFGKTSEQVQKS